MSSAEQPTLAEWLAAEPFQLSMSSGFFGFYAHAGVLGALTEREITPSAVSGSSSGALATGFYAAGFEPGKMAEELANLEREDFWDPSLGFGLLRGKLFDQKLRELLPVAKFEECNVTPRISVFDLLSGKGEALDRGDLALAIRASCALPVLFQPVMIDGRPKLDGGIKDRAGLLGVDSGERTFYHRLPPSVSKINPLKSQDEVLLRPNLKTLQIGDVPRVTPFSLHHGLEAYEIAKAGTLSALDQPAGQ
jgi:NTE family protein